MVCVIKNRKTRGLNGAAVHSSIVLGGSEGKSVIGGGQLRWRSYYTDEADFDRKKQHKVIINLTNEVKLWSKNDSVSTRFYESFYM